MTPFRRTGLLAALLAIVPWLLARAEEKPAPKPAPKPVQPGVKESDFMRITRGKGDSPVTLETAVVTYVSADGKRPGVTVDLIGAVHVGDKAYYTELNKRFESYDALLFELVAPEGTKIPKGGRREGPAHPVAAVQMGMKDMLGLEFQLEQVDYTKKNFVHADMSPDEFAKSMADRGESFMQLIFKMMGAGIAMQSDPNRRSSDSDMLMAFFSPNRSLRLKQAVAEQFDQMGGQLKVLAGPEGSTILTERNKKALEVLERELKAGKKKLGIFYGAAHLPDMHAHLLADYGLKRDKTDWLVAWDMHETFKPAKPKPPAEKK